MSSIPPEIKEFFMRFPGQSFLIRGRPGTGKTTLALEIVRELCEERNGIYISTRMEPQRLYAISPWIKEFIPERNVINATQSHIMRSLELTKLLDRSRISDHSTILDFFKTVFEDAEEMENPMIVFDSWDGILTHLRLEDEAPRLTQEIHDFCREMEIHVVFVTEKEEQTALDFIADGVVTLYRPWMGTLKLSNIADRKAVERRRVREIEINKLRGLPIKQSRYLFTLHGGRFHFFPPYKEDLSIRTEPIPDISETILSTGIKDLDGIIGGFPAGSFNLWEISYAVSKRYEQMLLQICMNVLGNGRGVIGIPLMGSFLLKEHPENLMVYTPETDDVNVEISTFISIARQNREKTGKPSFTFISLDSLANTFGPTKTVKFMENIARISRDTELLFSVLYIMREGMEISRIVTSTVDTHLVFRDVNGALVLYGIRPVTGLYGVTSGEEGIQLIPIV